MWGPGLRAELKRIWGLDPLEAKPGVGDRLCGQREEETSPRAYQRRPPPPPPARGALHPLCARSSGLSKREGTLLAPLPSGPKKIP